MLSHGLIALMVFILVGECLVRGIPLKLNSLECDTNDKYCSNKTCSFETKRNGLKLINFRCDFQTPITYPMVGLENNLEHLDYLLF